METEGWLRVNELLRQAIGWITCLFLLGQCMNHSRAQDFIQPAPDMPAFTLGSINQGKDAFGRPAVTIDYKRTKEGIGAAMLAVRTSDGSLNIVDTEVLSDESGELKVNKLVSGGTGLDGELCLVVSGSFAEECEFTCLVSNVVRVGNPAFAIAFAREWNSTESSAYQKELVGRKPPFGVPEGYQLVRASTKLIAGMPIKVGRYGKWVDAEALTTEATVTVKVLGTTQVRSVTRDGWLAIDPSVLQKGAVSPGSFKSSVTLIPGTTAILPDGYVVVDENINLVPGTPIRAIWNNQLLPSTVISIEGGIIWIHYESRPALLDKKSERGQLVIALSTIEDLAKPDAAQRFQDRVPKRPPNDKESNAVADRNKKDLSNAMDFTGNTIGLGGSPPQVLALQNNPIELPIPREAELLPLDFPIPRGTKLAACSGQKWNYVTVLKDNKEDTVPIHWDDRTPEFDGLIHRTQLIIRKSDLKKLRIKATRSERRIWTDATGKHTVEATLSSRTSTQITIAKDDGKEVTLSIDKLSAADQKWLRDNP